MSNKGSMPVPWLADALDHAESLRSLSDEWTEEEAGEIITDILGEKVAELQEYQEDLADKKAQLKDRMQGGE